MSRLLLIEFPEEIGAFAKYLKADSRIIALSPEAMFALDQEHIEYNTPADYYSPAELIAEGEAGFNRLEQLGALVDTLIKHEVRVEAYRMNPVYLHYYHLKILIDSIVLRIFELLRIVEAEDPQTIVYIDRAPTTIDQNLLFTDGSIYSLIIKGLLTLAQPDIEQFPLPATSTTRPAKDSLNTMAKKFIGARRKQILHLTRHKWFPTNARGAAKHKVVVLGQNKEIELLMGQGLAEQKIVTAHWDSETEALAECSFPLRVWRPRLGAELKETVRAELEPAWQAIRADLQFKEWFSYRGIDYWPIIEPRISYLFTHCWQEMPLIKTMGQKMSDARKPAAVIAPFVNGYRQRAFIEGVRSRNIPTFIYQHGGAFGYLNAPMNLYRDAVDADIFLTLGGETTRSLARTRPTTRATARFVTCGSARLSGLRSSDEHHSGALVYVPTNMIGHNYYIGNGCTSPNHIYFHLQRRILAALKRFERSYDQVIVKMPLGMLKDAGTLKPLPQIATQMGFAVSDAPLTSILPKTKTAVIDAPTTTLLEILAAQIPCTLVRHSFCRVLPEYENLLSEAVKIVPESELEHADLTGEQSGSDFLTQFGRPVSTEEAFAVFMEALEDETPFSS